MLVESNYLKDLNSLVKLLYHECLRVFADRIVIKEDYDWLTEKMKEIFQSTFDLLT
jgi:hypothetical protein